MAKHVRKLSTAINDRVRASVHAAAEAGQDVVTTSAHAVQRVLHYDQLPNWMRIDPYIRHGYRPQSNSFCVCFWSIFHRHNESVNIWSHLVPALCHFALLLYLDVWISHSDIKVSRVDNYIFQLYIVCTAGCDILSAAYHGNNSHSEHISRHFLKFVSAYLQREKIIMLPDPGFYFILLL